MNNSAENHQVMGALTFHKGLLPASNAAVQLDHKNSDQKALVFQSQDRQLYLTGALGIKTPAGDELWGKEVLWLLQETYCTEKELASFIDGEDVEALAFFTLISTPSYQWYADKDTALSTPFTVISNNMDAELYDINATLAENEDALSG